MKHITTALAGMLTIIRGHAAEKPTPGFNQRIPEKIMTPDTVNTRIGTLKFVDGVPSVDTTKADYDHLDFLRGVAVFFNFIAVDAFKRILESDKLVIQTDRQLIIVPWAGVNHVEAAGSKAA